MSKVARRLSWGVADQAMSSLTNFGVAIYVARSLGTVQFGAFSLAYVTYGFLLNASRGLATDPLMVRFSNADKPAWRRAIAASTGMSLVVGIVGGACLVAISMGLSGDVRLSFLALGLTLPGLMLQDSWRYAFFTLGRGYHAFINDTIWAIILFPALREVGASGHATVFWFVFVWGMAATVGAVAGIFQTRIVPRLGQARHWFMRHRDLGVRFLAEGAASSGTAQIRSYSIGLILGLASVGYVQAANTLVGPIMILFYGMGLVTTPEAARVLDRAPQRLWLFCMLISGMLAVAAIAWGAVLLVALPRGLGELALKSLWRPTYPLVLPQLLFVLGMCVTTGSGAGLHALGAARRSLRAMLIQSVIAIVASLAGAYIDGAIGTVLGAAVAAWCGVVLWWWEFDAALREAGIRGSGHAGKHRAPPSRRAGGRITDGSAGSIKATVRGGDS